ncbi:trypsin-like serine peptidase [Enterococcus sp. LJL99]
MHKIRLRSLFTSLLLVLFFSVGPIPSNAEEQIVSNNGDISILEESNPNSRTVKSSEAFVVENDTAVSRSIKTELPDDIGFPRTTEGFDYSFETLQPNNNLNSRAIPAVNNRQRVSNPNSFPYRASVLIICDYRTKNGGTVRGHGSGSIIGPNKVVTAAHVIYDRELGWAKTVRVYPAVKNNATDFNMAYGSILYTFGGYIQSSGTSLTAQQRDVSVIKLDSNLGNSTGWFGYTTAKSSYLRLNGYDGDIDDGRTLVTRYGTNTWIDSGILKYPWLTAGGSSGGGVYNPSNNQLEATHAYGYSEGKVKTGGGGAKINNAIFDFMSKY